MSETSTLDVPRRVVCRRPNLGSAPADPPATKDVPTHRIRRVPRRSSP